jgi:thiol peroxidase
MTTPTLKGNPVKLQGSLIKVGDTAPGFTAVKQDLSEFSLEDFAGKKKILNIFLSLDTGTCANSVRTFNQKAAQIENAVVLCLSLDLPFAHQRFCAAEGIEDVVTGSLFRSGDFAENYGILIADSPLKGLTARTVIILNETNQVQYVELVQEISTEPDYSAALAAL